jgi:hypothetical protein
MFSLLILVNGHKSKKKSFLSDSKWRLKFKMATNFQAAVTLVLMKLFSKFLLHFTCVENRENCGRSFSFWLKMVPLAQGVGQKLIFCHNFGSIQFFQICFLQLVLCY